MSPRILGVVDRPINLTAAYERQYMINVVAPFGASGGGWYAAGAPVTVTVPEEVESRLIFKEKFQGFAEFNQEGPTIHFVADGPMTITAIYSRKVNAGILALLLLIPVAAVVLFFGNRWILRILPRRWQVRRRRRAT